MTGSLIMHHNNTTSISSQSFGSRTITHPHLVPNAFNTEQSLLFKPQQPQQPASTTIKRKFNLHAPNLDHDDGNLKSDLYHSHLINTNTWISQTLSNHPNLLNYYYYAMQNHINHYMNMPPTPPHLNSQQVSEYSAQGSVSQLYNQHFLRSHHSTRYNQSSNSARSLDRDQQLYLSATFPEIMFITNSVADVISVDGNGEAWDAYLDAGLIHPMFNTLSPLAAYPLILGRNFVELIMCPKFQSILKFMLQFIATSEDKSKLSYHWLSDSFDTERKMRLTLTRLTGIKQPTVSQQQPTQFRNNTFYPYTATQQQQTSESLNTNSENPNVLFCWTSKIITETTRNVTTKNFYTHLAYPILPTIIPNSRGICMLCKRLQVSKSDMSPTQWLEVIQAPTALVSTKYPCMESDAKTPIFGKRGKLGVQLCDAISTKATPTPYLWLNGEQVVHLIRNRIKTSSPSVLDNKTLSIISPALSSCSNGSLGTRSSSSTSVVLQTVSETSSTTPSGIPNDHASSVSVSPYNEQLSFSPCTANGSPGSQFDLGSHLALPVHSSLCEVCRLDLLQFFSPMYTPTTKDTKSRSSPSFSFSLSQQNRC